MTFDRLEKTERSTMAERLRAARYVAGLTARAVADACDVNINSVIGWEHGSLPTAENRRKLAELYGVYESVLFAEVDARQAAAAALLR